jgi:Flp pilus assembly protein TadG
VAALWKSNLVNRRTRSGESGQALVEFALIGSMMIILALGVIDLGRAIYVKEVLSDLSRTGSNLASRGPCSTLSTCLTTAANAVITEPSDLNMVTNGLVIVTAVQANSTGTANTIIGQVPQGDNTLGSSKIGTVGSPAHLPVTVPPLPPANQTIYVTEVFYRFAPITPVGNFMTIVLPSTLYDVAYF